ncbi:Frequency clock [Lecanosticta acicola]|uniref:Frequency clock n=1 Tax=Lecanosticta acicola TaxID=111012 RepID=A0AAI9E8W0_9PEZI|nr:Frequency clock [Lecanosticta acicola]
MADERPHPTIVTTPPAQAGATSSPHPRRPPACRSVSLLHSSRKRSSPTKDQSDSSSDSAVFRRKKSKTGKDDDSPSSLQPLGRESSGGSSNAEKWFEKSNNELRDNSASFADNEPPFFMRNSSSSETPPEAQNQMSRFLSVPNEASTLPMRNNLLHFGTDGSSTDDFRSVIDDLTIENKKLKRRLKKYEKLHDSHLRDEKLFEVRIHGLPPEKKRELEETLRKFASGLSSNGLPAAYEGLLPVLGKQNTSSSQTSHQNTDSAYASMSGQGSSAQSGTEMKAKHPGGSSASRAQNIHTYLHQIPEGLLPQTNPANLTERSKKKLVVRRLEQIFAGKGAALGGHQHSQQQEDVSQMAARAERAAGEAQGQRSRGEGTREAHIMKGETEDPAEPKKRTGQDTSRDDQSYKSASKSRAQRSKEELANPDSQPTGEQRPTRPLDLDPHRAQVPAENLRYIRHLGFSPPDLDSERSPEEGHGWIYLNLLINMAQLHTIHVTSEFVKKALLEYSSKFEISSDGRKVRWKGRHSVTQNSSSGGSTHSRAGVDTPDVQSPRKRPRLSYRQTTQSGVSSAKPGAVSALRSQNENSKLVYTPMFFHRDTSEDSEDSSEDEEGTMSPYPAAPAGDSSGMTSSGMRTASTKKYRKRDDGPIIFYNNARFCTDLSGDRKPTGHKAPPYTAATTVPVGRPQKPPVATSEKRGPLALAAELPEPMDLDDNPIPENMELTFPPPSPRKFDNKQRATYATMEATGIGGIVPTDHFAIGVETHYALLEHADAQAVSRNDASKYTPAKFADILEQGGRRNKARAVVQERVVATNKENLPPSELPPALSFMPWSEGFTGDDDESDVDEVMSVSPESPGAILPSAARQPVELHYASSEEEGEDSEDDDGQSDDGSLDLLAAAREADPEAILQKEREYDANMADRLAEEIPAGSSAATAGGGSGFASPVDGIGMTQKQYQRALQESRGKQQPRATLQRANTGDSTKVHGPDDCSENEQEDEMNDVRS